jgi:ribosomal protein S18 acetylase RimI-like enzyme
MQLRAFRPSDELAVIALWRECGLVVPQNDPHKDIARKMQVSPELFIVAEADGAIIGSCMAGYEGHRGWINYLAVHPTQQRRGYATALMREAERLLRSAGCPKINLQVRSSNSAVIAFYESFGFAADSVVSLGKRLEYDQDGEQVGRGQPATRIESK